jgi:hypothetical protein
LRRAQPSESRELAAWIQERHYSDSGPAGYRYALEFRIDRDRVGGMLLGRPSGRGLDPELWLELSRVYFIDETPVNVESRGLAMMRRFVRVWVPRTRGLVAYSDPNQGHEGTIYAADGWAPFGTTKNGRSGWKNRSGRSRGDKPSRKQRWVRTP